jgi:hypothetical protein
MGPAGVEVCSHIQRAIILQKQVAHTLNTFKHHACKKLLLCVSFVKKNIFSPLQDKNKPCDGETEHAFILDSRTIQLHTSR